MFNIKTFLGLDYYTSPLDQFLMDFDQSHPRLSTSQRLETEKYKRIYQLRDHLVSPDQKEIFWTQF